MLSKVKIAITSVLSTGGYVFSGPLVAELIAPIEYATGLEIGMADLSFEAIEWYTQELNYVDIN